MATPTASTPSLTAGSSSDTNLLKKVSTAGYPFNNSRGDADVILETEEGIDVVQFYVHRAVLRIASAFFDDMFSLPQPTPPSSHCSVTSALPIIPMTEHAEAVDHLLRMCYPVATPLFPSIPSLSPVLRATIKYQMTEIVRVLEETLVTFCQTIPLEVFAEACIHNLEHAAQRAATAFCSEVLFAKFQPLLLKNRLSEYTPAMDNITTSSYFYLLQYYTEYAAHMLMFCSPVAQALTRTRSFPSDGKSAPTQLPFDNPHHGNAIVRSSDGIKFYVDRYILGYASPLLCQSPAATSSVYEPADDNTVFAIPAESHTIAALLQLCYPLPDPLIKTGPSVDDNIYDACELFDVASQYKVPRAQDYAKRACIAAANAFPLRLY